nr:type II toxin-antitoxin system ParD family antitoxin [Beijerinckia sp. L45]
MTARQHLSITLPNGMAETVEAKIRSGAYQSASEVIEDGLLALLDRDASVERWLRNDVLDGHAEYLADPTTGVAADEVLERIKAGRATSRN